MILTYQSKGFDGAILELLFILCCLNNFETVVCKILQTYLPQFRFAWIAKLVSYVYIYRVSFSFFVFFLLVQLVQ